jgi:hypothetical protein
MVEAISSYDNSYYSEGELEETNNLFESSEAISATTKSEELQFQPYFQSNLRPLFALEKSEEQIHYQNAARVLQEIKEKMQEWEENFAENIDTPTSREQMTTELFSFLTTIRREIDAALLINPHHPGYYIMSGLEQMMRGDILEAQKSFEKSAEIDPNFSDLENHLCPGDALSLVRICQEIINRKPTL